MGAIQYSSQDLKTPEGIERVLRQFESALSTVAIPATPNPRDLATALAPFMRDLLQAPGGFPLNLQSLIPSGSGGGTGVFQQDTHANRITIYTPPTAVGAVFFETDRTVTYVSTSTFVWRYASGGFVAAFASRPSDLGSNDSGFLFYATDQDTVYIWTGAAWNTISRRILLGGFFAIFTHANSADRTYTYPDATGNVPSLPTAATTETGTGAIVRQTSPSITTPTITTPTIADFTSANHDHLDADDGGLLTAAAISDIAGSRYTATTTNITNMSASSAPIDGHYIRVGDEVFVHIRILVTPTAAGGTASQVDVSLPIASNLTSTDNSLSGFCLSTDSAIVELGFINASTANDRAQVQFNAASNAIHSLAVWFSYRIQ